MELTVGPMWAHQANAVQLAESMESLGLFLEQGCGKSRAMIEILRRRYARVGKITQTVIFVPKIVCRKWKEEFKKYSKIHPSRIFVFEGSGKKRLELLQKAVEMYGDEFIAITNYEAVEMEEFFNALCHIGISNLVCDESQRLRNPASKRAKRVATLADKCKARFILSGTPTLDGKGMDVFMQFRILDGGETFGTNYFVFRNTYFYDKNAGMPSHKHFPDWRPNPRLVPIMQQKIDAKALRVLKKDCLDLPPLVRKEVYDEMTPEQSRNYKEMKKAFITWLDSQEGQPTAAIAQLAITKTLRLQQIVTGFVNDEFGNAVRIPCNRTAVLAQLLEDIPDTDKVIIWAVHQENYKQIAEVCKKLGRKYVELHGKVKGSDYGVKEKDVYNHVVNEFRTNPEVTVIIANQGAGGVGIDLIEAKYAIYYSKNFKLEDDLQSEARNYRGGSEMHDTVVRIDIVCPETIDELINTRLREKLTGSNILLDLRSV